MDRYRIEEIVDHLGNAESYVNDAVRDLEDMMDEDSDIEAQRDVCISIIRALLGGNKELFDPDDPQELLDLINRGNAIKASSTLVAFAYGYKLAVESRPDHYYINKIRAMIREQEDKEKQNAEANQDSTNPPGHSS